MALRLLNYKLLGHPILLALVVFTLASTASCMLKSLATPVGTHQTFTAITSRPENIQSQLGAVFSHPCFLGYLIHIAVAFFVTFMILRKPLVLFVILASSVAIFFYSWLYDERVSSYTPDTPVWWVWVCKAFIVNLGATAPTLLAMQFKWTEWNLQAAGLIAHAMLWLNIAWTAAFSFLGYGGDIIDKATLMGGCSLCISLMVRLVALTRSGTPLFRLEGGMLLGSGTSLSWLLCYSVWNALFVCHKDGMPAHTLQVIILWAMMHFFYYQGARNGRIEDYFAMTRPAQLGAYLMIVDLLGLIPFFRDEPAHASAINRHPYFLFISLMNFVYSLYVLWWETHLYYNPWILKERYVDTSEKTALLRKAFSRFDL